LSYGDRLNAGARLKGNVAACWGGIGRAGEGGEGLRKGAVRQADEPVVHPRLDELEDPCLLDATGRVAPSVQDELAMRAIVGKPICRAPRRYKDEAGSPHTAIPLPGI